MGNKVGVVGIIGIPTEEDIKMLEEQFGKPIKRIEKKGKVVLVIGKGLFNKKIVISCSE